jgi:hypothetical protein
MKFWIVQDIEQGQEQEVVVLREDGLNQSEQAALDQCHQSAVAARRGICREYHNYKFH